MITGRPGTANRRPLASVITPVRGRSRELGRLLSSLAMQDCARDTFEVIVADNPCMHNAAWLTRTSWPFPLQYEHVAAANRGLARNAGAARARGEWLLFVDSDVVAARSTVTEMLDAIHDRPRGVVMADVRFPPDEQRTLATHLLDVAAHFRRFRRQRRRGPLGFREFVSCAFGIAHSAFDRVGQFDETFWHYGYEDVEFALRAQAAGLSFDLAAHAYHLRQLDPVSVLARSTEEGRSAAQLVRLHPNIEARLPVGVADTIARVLSYPPDFDISALLSEALDVESQWANRVQTDTLSRLRRLLDRAYELYRTIGLYGRFTGITAELSNEAMLAT